MTHSSLPNLLVIGAMKCGSTSLHDYLNQHPDISMSTQKELDYFIQEANWNKGLDWYKEQFQSDAIWRGESSISYTKAHVYKGVPERIYDVLGKDVKLIYILRDPIARFQSNFTDGKTYGDIPPDYSINDFALKFDNPYLMTSRYHYQLKYFLNFYPLENILLLTAEDLNENPLRVLNEVADFLEIEKFDKYFLVSEKLNVSSEKQYRNKTGDKIATNVWITNLKKYIPQKALRSISGSKAYKKIIYNKIDDELDKLNKHSVEALKEYFKEEMAELRGLSGKKFENWLV